MTAVRAFLAFMQGVEAYRRKATDRLAGSPFMLRLRYRNGHPGIWEPGSFWIGRVGNQIRLVDQQGDRFYDLPLDRICGLSLDPDGRLLLRYEPTAGLVATVEFESEPTVGDSYRKLLQLMLVGA